MRVFWCFSLSDFLGNSYLCAFFFECVMTTKDNKIFHHTVIFNLLSDIIANIKTNPTFILAMRRSTTHYVDISSDMSTLWWTAAVTHSGPTQIRADDVGQICLLTRICGFLLIKDPSFFRPTHVQHKLGSHTLN